MLYHFFYFIGIVEYKETVSDEEHDKLIELVNALQPFHTATLELCDRKGDILFADGVMCALVDEMLSQKTPLAAAYAENIVVRYTQRRNINVLQLMRELQGKNDVPEVPTSHPLPDGKLQILLENLTPTMLQCIDSSQLVRLSGLYFN